MRRGLSVAAALEALDLAAAQDRRALARAQADVIKDVGNGRFPTWSAMEALAVAAPAVDLWTTVDHLHRARVLDHDAEPESAPSRLDLLRDEADRVLDSVVSYARVSGPPSPAGRLAERGEQVAELTWARLILATAAHLADTEDHDG